MKKYTDDTRYKDKPGGVKGWQMMWTGMMHSHFRADYCQQPH
jgi:hypothetical protein